MSMLYEVVKMLRAERLDLDIYDIKAGYALLMQQTATDLTDQDQASIAKHKTTLVTSYQGVGQ